jgi:hypothetical protein
MKTAISGLAGILALLAVSLNAQSPERQLHAGTELVSGVQLHANATGEKVVLTWSAGATCGTKVAGTVVTCKPNIYRCAGATSACPSFTGAPPSEWSLLTGTPATDTGTYTDFSAGLTGQVNYAITDCATDTAAGWTGNCPGSPGTGSESVLSNIAVVTIQSAAASPSR